MSFNDACTITILSLQQGQICYYTLFEEEDCLVIAEKTGVPISIIIQSNPNALCSKMEIGTVRSGKAATKNDHLNKHT